MSLLISTILEDWQENKMSNSLWNQVTDWNLRELMIFFFFHKCKKQSRLQPLLHKHLPLNMKEMLSLKAVKNWVSWMLWNRVWLSGKTHFFLPKELGSASLQWLCLHQQDVSGEETLRHHSSVLCRQTAL